MELLVVLAIIGLITLLLPRGFDNLFDRASIDSVAHSIAGKLRDCALEAQLQQRTVRIGLSSKDCALQVPPGYQLRFEDKDTLSFHGDGSSNGNGLVIAHDGDQLGISVNRLTTEVTVFANAHN